MVLKSNLLSLRWWTALWGLDRQPKHRSKKLHRTSNTYRPKRACKRVKWVKWPLRDGSNTKWTKYTVLIWRRYPGFTQKPRVRRWSGRRVRGTRLWIGQTCPLTQHALCIRGLWRSTIQVGECWTKIIRFTTLKTTSVRRRLPKLRLRLIWLWRARAWSKFWTSRLPRRRKTPARYWRTSKSSKKNSLSNTLQAAASQTRLSNNARPSVQIPKTMVCTIPVRNQSRLSMLRTFRSSRLAKEKLQKNPKALGSCHPSKHNKRNFIVVLMPRQRQRWRPREKLD